MAADDLRDVFAMFIADRRYIEPFESSTTDFYLFVLTFFIYYLENHAERFIQEIGNDRLTTPRRYKIIVNQNIHRIEANLQKLFEKNTSPFPLVSYPVRNIFHVEHTVSYLLHCKVLFPRLPAYLQIQQKDRVCTYVLDVGSYMAKHCLDYSEDDHG